MAESHVIEAVLEASGVGAFNRAIGGAQDQVEDLERSADKLSAVGDKMSSIGGKMTAGVTLPLVGGLLAITQGSEEMMQVMARLDTNTQQANLSTAAMNDELTKMSGVSDDAMQNVEGLSNLIASGFDAKEISTVTDALSGAAIKFSDTLQFGGLSDGLQETLATGKAAGSFAELLERSGVDLEVFDAKMAAAGTAGEKQDYILKTLAKTGLADVNEMYRKNNAELIESRESAAEFQQAMAEMSTTLTPLITTFTEAITGLVEWFNALSPEMQNNILIAAGIAAAIGPLIGFVGMLVNGLGYLKLAFVFLGGPISLIVAAVLILIGIFAYLWTTNEKFRDGVKGIWSSISDFFTGLGDSFTGIGDKIATVIEAVPAILDNFVPLFKQAGANLIGSIWDGMKSGFSTVLTGFTGFLSSIRDKLPFSPPRDKTSPLVGLNKNGITGEIAKGIYGGTDDVSGAMHDVLAGANREIEAGDGLTIDRQLNMTRGELNTNTAPTATNSAKVEPANLNVSIGGQVFRAFVGNISKEQDGATALELAY